MIRNAFFFRQAALERRACGFSAAASRPSNLLLALLLADLFCSLIPSRAADAGHVDFNLEIRPLLSDRCFKCHGPDEKARKAKLRLDLREGAIKELEDGWAVIKPGEPDKSELVRRIFTEDREDQMPPPESNLKLSTKEKELLKRWIAEGAEFKPHWAFIPVQPAVPPAPRTPSWIKNPIDAFVLARLEAENLPPAPEASRETLIRRLAFDLTGLPPAIAEIDDFLADASSGAYGRLVDRYLNSPHYGERMAMDWLDLARYADTYGYQNDVDRDLSPWRDWVIRAFNDNLPYDQFLLWQLAGDLLPNARREQRLATAFNRLHRQTNEGGSIDEEFRTEYVADRVNTMGTAVLGLTMECARCHDHKFDPITQSNYYSLFAFFNNIDESGTYSHFTRATPSPALLLWPESRSVDRAQIKLRMALAEERVGSIARQADRAFNMWLKEDGLIRVPRPVARFAFDIVVSNTTPDSVTGTNAARLVNEPQLVSGHDGDALQFNGDNELICVNVGEFKRTDAFSFSLWLKPTERQDRAVVFHQSRAWTDAGSRGFELLLDQGRPFFGLIHFWPGNAVAVQAKQPLPLNEWSHLTVAYDGSSRATGIHLYLNGARLKTEVVRDNLSKDIVHRKEWGDADVGKVHLTLAGRFRDSGFKNGLIDDLKVFDVCLAEPEVEDVFGLRWQAKRDAFGITESRGSKSPSSLRSAGAVQNALLGYFLARHHEPYREAMSELQRLRRQENDLINDVPEIMVMEELPRRRPAFVLKRGAYDAPGEPVRPDTPAGILPFPDDQPRNRLGLARWVIDRRNPLTARVAVNRIWRIHFGRGMVASQEDFGSQGRLPTHPALLDWLAGWFMDNGWDVKALHRLIVTSATYRQSSQAARNLVERDPENRLLARGPKNRLQAEQIRDSALAASGLLNRTVGGPSVKPYQPEGLWEQSGARGKYVQDKGDKLYRRSLYTFWKRTAPPPTMLTFDATSREVCTAKREVTTTPLQALVLLNDPQFVEAARALGERLLKEHPNDLDARIRAAFRTLAGRPADEKEITVLRQLFNEQQSLFTDDTETAENFLGTGESPWDKSLPRAELAATATLVSAVMNLDEFVMQR